MGGLEKEAALFSLINLKIAMKLNKKQRRVNRLRKKLLNVTKGRLNASIPLTTLIISAISKIKFTFLFSFGIMALIIIGLFTAAWFVQHYGGKLTEPPVEEIKHIAMLIINQ